MIAFVDFRQRIPDGCAGVVQVRAGCTHRVGGVLRALLQCRVLSGELPDLLHGGAIFGLERVQIGFGCDGGGVAAPSVAENTRTCCAAGGHLCLERFLSGSCVREALSITRLARLALLELAVGGGERAFVLRDGLLLERHTALQSAQLCGQSGGCALKALHARGGETEFALRFGDLFVDRLMFRVKLSVCSDSDTTRSRRVSLISLTCQSHKNKRHIFCR